MGNLDEHISKVIEIEFEDEFKALDKDSKKVLDKDKLINKIVSILKSEKIIEILQLIFIIGLGMQSEDSGCLFSILTNNPQNKYYFIQIIFEVLEKLKYQDWNIELNKMLENFRNESKEGKLHKNYNEYQEKIKNKKLEYLIKFENNKDYNFKIFKENAPLIISLSKYGLVFMINSDTSSPIINIKSYSNFFKDIKAIFSKKSEDECKSLIDYLNNFKNLYYIREFHKRIIFFIQLIMNKEKIKALMGDFDEIDKFTELNSKLSDNSVFIIFEETKSNNYDKVSLITNKYKEDIYSVDMFESIKMSENKTILNRIFCKSLFSDRKLIIEKLNLNYKASIEDIEKDLQEEIQFLLNTNYSYNDLIFQIENKLYRCPESYDVFIKEIMKVILFIIINRKKENKIIDNSINEEIKEAFRQIVEKEKKIKELETKISRYPFELNENEQLMSIIIKSDDNKINVPIICKNSFKFIKIEEKFYDMYSELAEKENNFTLNGAKLNKNKTLEENGIKDKDIIIVKNVDL